MNPVETGSRTSSRNYILLVILVFKAQTTLFSVIYTFCIIFIYYYFFFIIIYTFIFSLVYYFYLIASIKILQTINTNYKLIY